MGTDTARGGVAQTVDADAGMSPEIGAGAAATGGLVVLRDELGILSVMRCLHAELTLDPGFQRDYPADSAALAGLTDPRVAPPLSYLADATGQIVATVCRHVTGIRLSKVLAQLPRGLDVQTASAVLEDVLAALAALHARGVAHRSPDADHVIIEPDGSCVLVDAGLVRRTAPNDPVAAMAADLDLAAQLFVTCLITGRLLPNQATGPGYFAPGELEGVAARIYDALAEARARRVSGTAAVLEDAGFAEGSASRTALSMLTALEAAAADCFDAGWDGRGRERLAAAAKDHRSTRRRFLEFRPTGNTDHRWSIRGWHAAAPPVHRGGLRISASASLVRRTRARPAGT